METFKLFNWFEKIIIILFIAFTIASVGFCIYYIVHAYTHSKFCPECGAEYCGEKISYCQYDGATLKEVIHD